MAKKKHLRIGIQNINPHTKFNILSTIGRLFNNLYSPASRKNVIQAISFIQENVDNSGDYSIEQRLVQIYENCKNENIHVIILCDNYYHLKNLGIIQYIMLKAPKQALATEIGGTIETRISCSGVRAGSSPFESIKRPIWVLSVCGND